MIAAFCNFDCIVMNRLNELPVSGCSPKYLYSGLWLTDAKDGWPLRRLSLKCPKVAHTLGEVSKRAWSRRESGESLRKVAPRGVSPNWPSRGSVKTPKLAKVRSIRCKE